MYVSLFESAKALRTKKEKDHVQLEECDQQEERREVQLRLRDLLLRVPGQCVHLPGDELPVRLRQTQRPVIAIAAYAASLPP